MSCTAGEPFGEIHHEVVGGLPVPLAEQPRNYQLRVSINRGPRPRVARAFRCGLRGLDVLRLRVAELPDLIYLDAFRLDVANRLVVERDAGFASVHEQLGGDVDGRARDAADRP